MNFKDFKTTIDSNIPTLVDFYADWCAPCKRLKPTIQKLKNEYIGKCNVIMVDVEKNPEYTYEYQVRSIPRIMLFKNGEIVENSIIDRTERGLKRIIQSNIT